jgi:hypothetical protein
LKRTVSYGVRVLVQGWPVLARSVEVIEKRVEPVGSFDAEDKKAYGSVWRAVHDLDKALAEQGLVCREIIEAINSWASHCGTSP